MRDHEDNVPDLEDYLEAKGTVFVTVQLKHSTYAMSYVEHLEIYNRPPTFAFEDHGQVCFVGNINGGDSLWFSSQASLMQYLTDEYGAWLVDTDAASMTSLDNIDLDQVITDYEEK